MDIRREREGGFSNTFALSAAQREASETMVKMLGNNNAPRQLIVLEGLSGVGKDSIIQQHRQLIYDSGTLFVPYRTDYPDEQLRSLGLIQNVVTTALPAEIDEAKKIALATGSRELKRIVVAGMNQTEIKQFVASLDIAQSTLSAPQIIQYSLGIPLLAQQLAMPGITEQIAERIAGNRLRISISPRQKISPELIKASAEQYLRVPLPWDNIQRAEEVINTGGSFRINLFERWLNLKRNGIDEESPLFIAPESDGIYQEMSKKQFDNHPDILIIIPKMPENDFKSFQNTLGLSGRFYDLALARRASMFVTNGRKVAIWSRDNNDRELTDTYYAEERMTILQRYLSNLEEIAGRLNSVPNPYGSFIIWSSDHMGSIENPIRIGLMTESWLQHKGVPYAVENHLLGRNYIYSPQSRHVEFLPVDHRLFTEKGTI